MSGCEPGRGNGPSREFYEGYGGASGRPRPLNVSEKTVAVTADEQIIAYTNDARRNLVLQNIGANPVQVYTTNGLPFAGGGIILGGQSLTATPPQIGGVWIAAQDGVGVIQKSVFARCAAGKTSTLAVNEES